MSDLVWGLAFAAILAGIVVVLWLSGIRARMPGQVDMMLLGNPAGEVEAHTWVAALGSRGIYAKVISVGDRRLGEPTAIFPYEIWVPARDYDQAREVLGF